MRRQPPNPSEQQLLDAIARRKRELRRIEKKRLRLLSWLGKQPEDVQERYWRERFP
jgi:hypothetical protein